MKTTLMNTVSSEHRARIGAVLCVTALRLTELDREGYNGSGGTAIHQLYKFAYDTFDNTTSIKVGNKTLATYSYGSSAWPDLLTAYDGETIAYEGHTYNPSTGVVGGVCTSGNPISYYNGTRWTFDWKNGRELASATDGTHTITYDYDVNGLRTYKIVDGVRHDYVYASGLLLQETYTDPSNSTAYTFDFLYDQAGRPYMLNYTQNGYTTPYYYVLNLQGDVIAVVNSNGTEVAKYSYDAWGNVTADTSLWMSNRNPLRYRGYYYDKETGFYYLQSRYYDPVVKRFLNADSYASTGQGFLGYNMFAYCLSNPVNYADEIGGMAFPRNINQMMTDAEGATGGSYTGGGSAAAVAVGVGVGVVFIALLKLTYDAIVNRPSVKKISLNMNHILSGHSSSGNRGPNKDRFPSWMTPLIIEKAIKVAYQNAEKAGPLQYSWTDGTEMVRQFLRGHWGNMVIELWFNYTIKMIETAWPK